MRHPIAYVTPVLALCLLPPGPAWAQSDQADAPITVEILPQMVTVTNTTSLDFGQVYATSGLINSSDVVTSAQWIVDTSGAAQVQIELTVPTEMVGASGNSTIPLIYQPQSGLVSDNANAVLLFDPQAGAVVYDVDPSLPRVFVTLGQDIPGDGSGDVSFDPLGAAAEVHTATATLTVTII